jgi:hypothetical protein
MTMEYTHEESCDMVLTLGNRNRQVGAIAGEYALRHPGWNYPNTNMFLLLEQQLREIGSYHLRHMWMRASHGMYRHQPMNTPKLQLWNESRVNAHATPHGNWDYPNRGSSKYFMTINCIHTTTRGEHICFQTMVFCGCRHAMTSMRYGWVLLT